MTVAEMMTRMSWVEYQHWRVIDQMDPIGSERTDWQTARIVQAVIATVAKTPPGIADCLPFRADRFGAAEDDDDEREFSVAGFVAAARRQGMPVVSPPEADSPPPASSKGRSRTKSRSRRKR